VTKPFGQETHEEKDRIRARLIAEGHPDKEPELFFAVESQWQAEAQAKPTFAERQWWMNFRWGARSQKGHRRQALTREEMQYLLDRLAGVNDPLGIRCADVLRAQLEGLTHKA
jgi:hypothetical protein